MCSKKVNLCFWAFVLSFLVSFTAAGDDLDIYIGGGSEDASFKPNVLFIMDTSGSMRSKDNTTTSRMQKVQDALRQALTNATNINAGLMRFSNHGGPILYPVRDIDADVAPELIVPVTHPEDDGVEIGGTVTTVNTRIVHSQDDSDVLSAYRFRNLAIPQGATITGAYVRFTSVGYNNIPTNFVISADDVGDSAEITNTPNNLSERTKTSQTVLWDSENHWPESYAKVVSPDISSVIQEVVNNSEWCGGNNLTLFMQTESPQLGSYRASFSNDDGRSAAPQLVITYDKQTATGCVEDEKIYQIDRQSDNAEERSDGRQATGTELTFHSRYNSYIGLRFANIDLSQGATIKRAYLEFTATRSSTDNNGQMTIRGVNEDNPEDFYPYTRYLLRNKPKTSASVSWTSIPKWNKKQVYQSPDITAVVQEIVNRAGWERSNAIMLVLSDFNYSLRGANTFRGKPSGAAKLIIEYEGNASPDTISTVRQHLISKVDELSANGYTPIVDTLYEATRYFGGLSVDYGRRRGEEYSYSTTIRRETRVSHRDSYEGQDPIRPPGCTDENLNSVNCEEEEIPLGATYISPIADLQCQTNNHIVLLSDGQANYNHSVDKIQEMLSKTCISAAGGELCGLDLVKNINDSGDSVIDARVVTHTIGFSASTQANTFLNQLALQGGGGFYQAEDSSGLLDVFETILRQVKDVNATFVSPGVAVNQLNRLSHRDELYFALFKPAEGTNWPGNLKKYKISSDVILDQNGVSAVDSSTGFFSENSHSYWSTLADGNDVREGGAVSRLDLLRKMYFFENTPGSIFSEGNVLNENNSNITTDDVATTSLSQPDVMRTQVLQWARGVDVRDDDGDGSVTDVRHQMGDPIHSQPVIVNYAEDDSAVFVATNQGFLHSIDAEDGSENFAIIPKELLSNLYDFYSDGVSFNHIYGLDGDMVIRNVGEKKYLYVGMRRGGNNYYVFDITLKNDPKLVFTIDGGQGDYANLGQTWSRPIITKVNIGGTVKNVMIVGGGYDETQDDKLVRSADTVGNSVFMIDADTGALLWSASNTGATYTLEDMKYSIPARVSVIDRDKDGLADHMYVADMGGQIFRLDIYNGKPAYELVSGGLLASFSGDDEANNRRFYYGPDVSEVLLGQEQFYAVTIGSGFRAGPLNTVINDQFYMIRDNGIFVRDSNGKFSFPTTTHSQDTLYDATVQALTSQDDDEREAALEAFATKKGWYINLVVGGEKVLASPLTLDYKVFFTTYLPASSNTSQCAPPAGNSRAYLVNLLNGNAVRDLNRDNVEDASDRSALLAQTGIAPDTKILIENIATPVVCLGAECVSAVINVDDDGNEIACGTEFECLAQNIYGRFERVKKDVWKTEIEKQ